MKKTLLFTAIIGFLLTGCDQFENPEVPSYIRITSYNVNTEYGIEGTDKQQIESVHIYVGGQSVGYYDIPATIPILKSGEQSVEILPGILENGIAETGTVYPFFQRYKTTLNLVQDSIIQINPQFSYYDECVIWNEDFEDPAVKFDTDPTVGHGIELTDNEEEVFELDYSAKVTIDDNNPRFKIVSDQLTDLPTGGAEVFMELHYKNENSVLVGIIAGNSSGENIYPIVILNSQESDAVWKKMYINLKNYVSDEPNATYFKIFIDGVQDEEGTSTDIYFDNIKVVHT